MDISQTFYTRLSEQYDAEEFAALLRQEMLAIFEGNIRILPRLPGITGWYLEGRVLDDLSINMQMNRCLSLQLIQSAKGWRQISGRRARSFLGGGFYLSCFPDGARQQRFFEKDTQFRYVGLWVTPEHLQERFLDPEKAAGEQIAAFLSGDLGTPIDLDGVMTVRMQNATDDFFTNSYSGLLRDRFLESKVTELLCSALPYLLGETAPVQDPADTPRALRQRLKIQRAGAILETELHNPPGDRALARRVSLGHNRLNSLFQEIYGCTIHQYSKRCRMMQAEQLIRGGQHSMTDIAHLSGYRCQSSFSRAYRQYFGINPSASRPQKT